MNTKMLILLLMMALSVSAMAVNLNGTWYTGSKSGTPYLSSTTSNSFTFGQVPPDDTTATTGALWSYFTDLTLAQPGDRITLDFSLTLNDAAEGGRDFRFGLFNDGGTRVLTNLPGNNADGGFLDTLGYYVRWSVNSTGNIYLYTRTTESGGATNPVSTSNSITLTNTGGNPGVPVGVTCHFTFSIAVINDTEYQVSATLDTGSDVKTVTATTTETGTTTFNTFMLLNTLTEIDSMTFGNMKVVYNDWAWNPTPAIGEIDVELNPTLSWSTGLDPNNPASPNSEITAHKLYGNLADADDPNMFFIAELPVGTTTYPVTGLQRDKTYKWRIDEVLDPLSDPCTITGMEWTFDTVLSVPDITGQPENVRVFEGEPASLTVVATNPFTGDATGLAYQWYRGLPGDTSTPVGTDSATYTIPSVALADEGSYYCIVEITSNSQTSESQAADLTVKRLLAHWPFDNNLVDVVSGNDAISSGSASYAAGIVAGGNAIDFSTGDSAYIATTAYANPSWTLAWWDITAETAAGTWESMVASGPTTGFEYLEADRVSSLEYRAGFNTDGTWLNAGEYPRQQWYHHALSFDDATGICTWYINGESVGTMTGSRLFADYDEDLYVGDCKNGSQPFAGSIDDLRLYNYPLNSVEAASLYVEVTGGTACAEPLAYDLNDDCKMDLQDFAMFAATWADCGLVPDCLP